MSVKKYIVQGEKDIHEYSIEVEDMEPYQTKYSIFASHDSIWSEHIKGGLLFSLIDDGNGIKLPSQMRRLDYSEVVYMRALLNIRTFLEGERTSPHLKVVELIQLTTI